MISLQPILREPPFRIFRKNKFRILPSPPQTTSPFHVTNDHVFLPLLVNFQTINIKTRAQKYQYQYQEKNMYAIFRKSISRMCQLLLYTLESYCGFVIIFILYFTFNIFTLFYAFICCKNWRQGHSAGAGKQSRAHINY